MIKRAMITAVAGVAAALFQVNAHAVDAKWAQAEAKEHGCLGCHAVDKKKVGPSYESVSAKYKGKSPEDLAGAAKKIPVHGSVMKKISDQDLKLIAEWILTL